ncbi:MAG: hypothetical protein PQJ61_01915 [Spirochaetales bacterium]|uniref:PQ loop repeat protein n=1 Tax=Candidatus Thalassospirochaeta sargassi TaxID=3119039 RepID=A0AAJ1IA65_9SPIO|nr:hypothetical protein [Spirochaetales bacterium]
MNLSIFEMLMLICFGAAWPLNIYKSIRSTSTKGKSLLFLYVIGIGYVCGILHKIYFNYDMVIFLYILNLLMVTFDIILYYRNRRIEKAQEV